MDHFMKEIIDAMFSFANFIILSHLDLFMQMSAEKHLKLKLKRNGCNS